MCQCGSFCEWMSTFLFSFNDNKKLEPVFLYCKYDEKEGEKGEFVMSKVFFQNLSFAFLQKGSMDSERGPLIQEKKRLVKRHYRVIKWKLWWRFDDKANQKVTRF